MSARHERLLMFAVPFLLCAVAAAQQARARLLDLSPWKGGGFGMFSTIDSPGARFVRIYLVTAEKEIAVTVPAKYRRDAIRTRTDPTPWRAARLAAILAAREWVPVQVTAAPRYYRELLAERGGMLPDAPRAEERVDLAAHSLVRMVDDRETNRQPRIAVRGVRVEVWRLRFDGTHRRLIAAPIVTATAKGKA